MMHHENQIKRPNETYHITKGKFTWTCKKVCQEGLVITLTRFM